MKRRKAFPRTQFPPAVWEKVLDEFIALQPDDKRSHTFSELSVDRASGESWSFDSLAEFLSEMHQPHRSADLTAWNEAHDSYVSIYETRGETILIVQSPSRDTISRVSGVLERLAEQHMIPDPPPPPPPPPIKPTVFVGHGRSGQWRDLKDHLSDLHGFDVEAYETGARAGHTIRDIVEQLARRASFAVLVMTGEDETGTEGLMRARQNVVHETGLFQGTLGFHRAIVLVEEGVEDYSNLQGVHQIRYSKSNIKETFGEVVATIRREFPT